MNLQHGCSRGNPPPDVHRDRLLALLADEDVIEELVALHGRIDGVEAEAHYDRARIVTLETQLKRLRAAFNLLIHLVPVEVTP